MRCLKRSNYDVSQLLAAKRRKKDTSVTLTDISFDEGQRKDEYIKPLIKYEPEQRKDEVVNLGSCRFDQERSRLDLAYMIILHGYPLAMVDHVGFKSSIHLQAIMLYPFTLKQVNLMVLTDLSAVDKFKNLGAILRIGREETSLIVILKAAVPPFLLAHYFLLDQRDGA
ncbi:hypothetical protein Pint_04838 [Pistacia integerrima]|uniref:Uncharacterized protein n=1 Tax=Pistacia integerrima TaxID=434235 RepID=A0ACC0Z2K6_9ROSI|nr:hypothetical protein Pint_04838 [Pistacia integerrima]